ncbi:MAG: hypothetical protein QNJ20_12985 [Paracoccaceae bacterium]|nr:hypothetical protein [Paracoccaceae bacterium]
MRVFAVFTAMMLLASCAAVSPSPKKLAIHGPNVKSSPTHYARSSESTIEARGLRLARPEGDDWAVHLSIVRADGERPSVTAVYALGTLMPYIPVSAEGAREDGYIPMNEAIFKALSETGLKVEMLGADNRLHVVEVPARTFAFFFD